MKDPERFLRDLTDVLNLHRVVLGYDSTGYLVARDVATADTVMHLDFDVVDEPRGTIVVTEKKLGSP